MTSNREIKKVSKTETLTVLAARNAMAGRNLEKIVLSSIVIENIVNDSEQTTQRIPVRFGVSEPLVLRLELGEAASALRRIVNNASVSKRIDDVATLVDERTLQRFAQKERRLCAEQRRHRRQRHVIAAFQRASVG